ncbi:OmpA family protein [Sphingopyxis witflariensis]|uniref:Cell envelope biogenesis protein OmpA n=1 Tax=Sphingopyxis witflariensis TaxID=173675 RepID=A0A246JXV1_9SPHN|nr:OmpA family protein [Sphingopyxis witflariensis]OWQ97912.1 cell envelope biogenesis protein OmpA [Sphingopyxis witflariensis]
MTYALPPPFRVLFVAAFAALLAACQSAPAPRGFTAAQIVVLKAEGFLETANEADDSWQLTLNERLLFPSNESALQPGQDGRIMALARNLLSVDIVTARVEGHSDSTGAAAYNLALSQARAQAVAAPMTAGGMRFTPDQIVGRGETLPLSSNDTPEGRQDNRRVVVIVAPQ